MYVFLLKNMHICIYLKKNPTTILLPHIHTRIHKHMHTYVHACLQLVLGFMAVQRQDRIEFLQAASIKKAEKHRGGGCSVRMQLVLDYLFNKSSNNIYQI